MEGNNCMMGKDWLKEKMDSKARELVGWLVGWRKKGYVRKASLGEYVILLYC